MKVRVSCTSHPANTSLVGLLERSFPGSIVALGETGKLSIGASAYFVGTDGEMIIRGQIPTERDLDALFVLLSKIVSIRDDCDVTACVDVYRTPVEGLPPDDWPFTQVGRLLSAAKYGGDRNASAQIAKILHNVIINHPALCSAEAIAAIPPHQMAAQRNDCPEQWARLLCQWLTVPYAGIRRTRAVAKQRDIKDPDEARRNQPSSMAADESVTRLTVLAVDDFYTDGETMAEAARALREAGATSVLGLCAAKTAKGGLHGVA